MQPKQDEIYRSKFYGDEVRLIIHNMDETTNTVSAYFYDASFLTPYSEIKDYILDTFNLYYELVEG